MVTGHGLKTVEALAGAVGPTATIAPTLEAFAAATGGSTERADEPAAEEHTMSINVRIPTQLRTLTGGAGEVAVEGSTVGEVLKALDAAHAGFADRLFDDQASCAGS